MANEITVQCTNCHKLQRVNTRDSLPTEPIFPFVCTRCFAGEYRIPGATNLLCPVCGLSLKHLGSKIELLGEPLGCFEGHQFYLTTSAQDTPALVFRFNRRIKKFAVARTDFAIPETRMGRVTSRTRLLRG